MNTTVTDCIKTLASLDRQPWWIAATTAGALEQINADPMAITLRQAAICVPRQGSTEYRLTLALAARQCHEIIRLKKLQALETALGKNPPAPSPCTTSSQHWKP